MLGYELLIERCKLMDVQTLKGLTRKQIARVKVIDLLLSAKGIPVATKKTDKKPHAKKPTWAHPCVKISIDEFEGLLSLPEARALILELRSAVKDLEG